MSSVCIIELWCSLITIKSLQWGMWIVDESAAFRSGYIGISNRTIETVPNVILSESMIRDRGEIFREWPALTAKDIIDCSKIEEQWGMPDLHKDLKASTQVVNYIWTLRNTFFTMRATEHCHRLPEEVLQSPSLEITHKPCGHDLGQPAE